MNHQPNTTEPSRSLAYAALIGIGVMAGLDEIVFHQLLQWHHFFDRATSSIGILSDGLLHAAELIALVVGSFLIINLARHKRLAAHWAWAGGFLGAGGFQLFDGIVNHKLLRLHQIRYGVDPLPYDLGWNASALILLLIGVWLLRRAKAIDRHHSRN